MAPTARPSAWQKFWKSVIRFQADKVNPWLGLRNMLGVTIPLAAGAAMGSLPAGLIVCTGALNVAFRDSDAPYGQRAQQMLLASVVAGVTVFTGSVTGHDPVLAVTVAALWAFAAGMLVAISGPAADLGTMSVVMLAVYAAVPMDPRNAVLSGLAAFTGGLLQTLLSLAPWPGGRYVGERRALTALYAALSRAALAPPEATLSPPATAQINEAQNVIATLDRDRSVESERYRFLLSQAERMRLSLVALARLRLRLRREQAAQSHLLDRCFQLASHVLAMIGESLRAAKPVADCSSELAEMEDLAEQLRKSAPPELSKTAATLTEDARFQVDALAGQLRSAADVTPTREKMLTRESSRPWRLRLTGRLAILRANLNVESAACRHAIRLAGCIVIGEVLGREMGWSRSYWIPMTIAIVLKPDFGGTFSRGLLRLAGTFAGLVFATGLFRILPHTNAAPIVAVAGLMFITRWIGPANYGIVATAITALVVLLVSLTGVPAGEVIAARASNTAVGGIIALAAYWLWPTWERHQVSDGMAGMLEQYRRHFRAIQESLAAGKPLAGKLEKARVAARLARSNMEASIERASAEPGVSPEVVALLTAVLASSHRLAHALMSLEAALDPSPPGGPAPGEPFARFAKDVDLTLYYLAAVLRGSGIDAASLPDLREDYYALIHASDAAHRDSLANVEADRITNTLNTLTIEVFQWTGGVSPSHAKSA